MATYNELFPYGDPRLSEIDPIAPRALSAPKSFGSSVGAATRRALPTDGGGFDLNQFEADLDALMGSAPAAPKPNGETQWGDSIKNLGAGVAELGAMATGALEYGSRQLLGDENESFVTDRLAAGRRGLTGVADDITATMSPEAQERLVRQWDTLDPTKSIWQGGADEFLSSVGYKLGRSIPSTLATLGPAAWWLKAGMAPGAIAYLGASEGALSMGGISNGIAQEIEGMTEEELRAESPRYQQMLQEGEPPGVARQKLIGEAQGAAPLIGGLVVGAISATAGRYLEPIFVKEGGMGLTRRALTGFAAEAPQESGQSVAEQMAQNIAAQIYDGDRGVMEGTFNAGIEGGVVGGLSGGAFSATLGQRPQRRALQEAPPAAETEQFVDPAIAAAIKNSDLASQQEADLAGQPTMAYGQGEMFGPPPGQPDFADTSQEPGPAMVRTPPNPAVLDEVKARLYADKRGGWPEDLTGDQMQRRAVSDFSGAPEPAAFGGTDPAGFALRQDQFQFSYPLDAPQPGTALALPEGGIQQPLGLREPLRSRGALPGVITPLPAAGPGPMADQSAPEGFSNERVLPDRAARLPVTRADTVEQLRAERYAGTVRDENQIDMFEQGEAAAPTPSASKREVLGFRVTGRGPDGAVRYEQDADTREEAQAVVDQFSRNEQGELTNDDTQWTVEPVSTLTGGTKAPDAPTAEPMVDLMAQQEDLADPDSPRLGLYLSRDNVAELRKQGTLDQVRSRGVPLMNFDLRGGTLIAKNRQVADELLAMRKQGVDMQEILGLATGAGTGKPADGRLVVQQRDESGGVTREQLVRNEEEADAVSAQWEQEDPTREVVVMRADAALGRRATKVKQETKQRAQAGEKRVAARAVSDAVETLPADVQGPVLDYALAGNTRAEAADLMAEAAQVADETQKRKRSGKFESPDNIRFKPRRETTPARVEEINARYRRLYDRYETLLNEETSLRVQQEISKEDNESQTNIRPQTRTKVQDNTARADALRSEREDVERSLKTFKQSYEYETTASDIAKAAEKVDAAAVRKRRASSRITMKATPEVEAIGDLTPMTPEEVDALSEGRIDEEFMKAANYMSGLHVTRERDQTVKVKAEGDEGRTSDVRPNRDLSFNSLRSRTAQDAGATNEFTPSGGTIDDYVASYPTLSEKKKLIKRAQRELRKQEGGRRGKLDKISVGRSRINVSSLIVEQETQADIEKSAEKRAADREEASAAYKELGRTVRSIQMALARVHSVDPKDVEAVAAGRAYLRNMYQIAIGLLRSGDRSPAAAKTARKFNSAINQIIGNKEPKALAKRLAELGRREFIMGPMEKSGKANFSQAFRAFIRGDLKDFTKFFRTMTEAQLNDVMSRPGRQFLKKEQRERLAEFERAAEKWLGSAHKYYRDMISPVLVNMKQRPDLAPSDIDIKRVRTALLWIGKSPQFSAMINDPIVAQLESVGFTFSDKGVLEGWKRGDTSRSHDGAAPDWWIEQQKSATRAKQRKVDIAGTLTLQEYEKEQAQKREQERLAAMQPMVDKYDRAVSRLMKEIGEAVSPTQISMAEEKFYASLRRLGVWKDANIASLLPAGARSYNKRVGPRLARKELTMAQAARELRNTFMEIGQVTTQPAKLVEDKVTSPERTPRKLQMAAPVIASARDESHQSVAARLANYLNGFETSRTKLGDALRILDAHLPADSPYRDTVKALLRVPGINALKVEATYSNDTEEGGTYEAGRDVGEAAYVTINLAEKFTRHPDSFVHTLVHEATHAASAAELLRNDALRAAWQQLRRATYSRLNKLSKSSKFAYGDANVLEFVAEVFSNKELQDEMRNARVESFKGTLWERAVELVRRLLGMPQEYETLLDIAMSLRDSTFSGRQITLRDNGKLASISDRPTLSLARIPFTGVDISDRLIDNFKSTKNWRDAVYDLAKRSKENVGTGTLGALTMSQISDFFSNTFSDGSLSRYYDAFTRRNADNSKNMEAVDAYSREWTKLIEKHGGEQAANFSRVMTQATVHAVHPDLPITAKENAHLVTKDQRAKHAELAKMYAALPAWHSHYQALKKYYRDTHDKQQALAVLNALRAYLTTGKNPEISVKEFDSLYTEDNVLAKKLNTKKGLQAEFGDKLDKAALVSIAQLGALRTMSEGPYFPLKRFGQYTTYAKKLRETKHFNTVKDLAAYREELRAKDPTLQFKRGEDNLTLEVWDEEFRMAETPSQARDDYNELVSLYGRENTKPINLKREEFNKAPAISGTRGLKSILDRLEGNAAAQAAVKNFYLASLAESSFRKHEKQRQNTRGFRETDQHRTFATYSKAAAYYMSQLRYGWKMADARADIGKFAQDNGLRAGQVAKEIRLRDEMTTDPEEISTLVQKASEVSQFMLLSSVSYWLVNMSQPWLVTQPYLGAKYGWKETAQALTQAQALIAPPLLDQAKDSWAGLRVLGKGGKTVAENAFMVLDDVRAEIRNKLGEKTAKPYLDMLTDLQRRSIIDLSFVAELRQIADGSNVNTPWQRTLDATRIMAHLTEVNNRIMTAIAAYDLSFAKYGDHDLAVSAAEQAVEHTQFNYSGANSPRYFQSDLGRIAFQFMKYPQHMYALMARQTMRTFSNNPTERKEAFKILGGVFATHFAVGGLIGATLQPLKIIAGMIMAGLDDEDDRAQDVISGAKFDMKLREWSSGLLNDDLGRAVSKGPVGAMLGTDLSARMSLGSLYFLDLNPESAETLLGSIGMTFGGPSVGIAANAYKAMQYVVEGDVAKAVETTAPKFLKDLMRAKRFAEEGITGRDGTTYLGADSLSARDVGLQALGFGTMKASESFSRGEAIRTKQDVESAKRSRLIRGMVNATSDSERAAALEAIREYSKGAVNPITRSDILKAMRRRVDRNARIDEFGADLRGRNVLFAEEGEPYDYGEDD